MGGTALARRELTLPIVPNGSMATISIVMNRIMVAEARGEEVAIVTPQKAPELLATYNRAYLDASEAVAKLKYEETRAEQALAVVKATLLIDKIPNVIKDMGLANSADTRQALVDADAGYQAAKDLMDRLTAAVEYMKGKMKFLENAYTAVKKIMDTNNFNMAGAAKADRLVERLGGSEETEVGHTHPQFGKARY